VKNVVPTSIASNGSEVFFTSDTFGWESSPGQVLEHVGKVPVAGGAETILALSLIGGSIAIEGSNVFWSGANADHRGLWQLPTSGETPTVYVVGASLPQPQVMAVASDAFGRPHLYWAVGDNAYDVHAIPVGLGLSVEQIPLIRDPVGFPYGDLALYSVVVDAANLYLADAGGALYRLPRAGGIPVKIESGLAGAEGYYYGPIPIATDGKSVFYVKDGSIKKIPVGGGAAATFASDVGNVYGMAVHDGALYWSCPTCGTIEKQPIASGARTTLAANEDAPTCIAVDDSYVYWGTYGALRRTFN
jgi:hypothetical protein